MPKSSRSQPSVGQRLAVVAAITLLLWIVELADWLLFAGRLDTYGIRPRSLGGLWGIPAAPFLHGDFSHLASNTAPFLILGGLVAVRGIVEFCEVSLVVLLVAGAGTWVLGDPQTVHIGASGMIFGYFGCLALRGVLEARLLSILVGILVIFLYGGLIWGVLPNQPGVSWEGHLFGLIGGAAAGWILTRLGAARR